MMPLHLRYVRENFYYRQENRGCRGLGGTVPVQRTIFVLRATAWLLLLGLVCPGSAHAYLDPGTGSMLVSALVGIAATLFFMAKAFYYKGLGLFFRLLGAQAPPAASGDIVFYCEGSQYWSTFKPVLEALDAMDSPDSPDSMDDQNAPDSPDNPDSPDARHGAKAPDAMKAGGRRVLYLSSDRNDPGLKQSFRHVECRYIGEGSRAFAVLNMLEADICVLTTPGLDVLQIRRSPGVRHYAHLVHAMTDMAIYKLFSFDYFDSVLVSGPHQERSLRSLERLRGTKEKLLPRSGCPYLDVLADKLEAAEADHPGVAGDKSGAEAKSAAGAKGDPARRILVAPTWGGNGLLARFGLSLLEPLAQSGHEITIRPHPQSRISEAPLLGAIASGLELYPNVRWDNEPDGFKSMLESDLLISDLSGIVFDYAFVFERPVITVRFEVDTRGLEAGDLPWPAWELDLLPELGARIEAEEAGNLPALIAALPGEAVFRERMRRLRAESLYNYRQSGQAAARHLLDIQASLRA